MPLPKQQITVTHDSENIDFSELSVALDIWLRENKGSNANLTALNKGTAVYLNQIEQEDVVRISLKRTATDSWTKVFGGYAVDLTPEGSASGLILPTKCYGFDIAFDRMRVANEYGIGSVNNSLKTVFDVLCDNSVGIFPLYVEFVLKTVLSSGYDFDKTYIYEDAADFLPYCIFPYSPVNDTLKTLLDLYTAANGTGLHWTVTQPDTGLPQFCLDRVNNHTTASARWPTNCPISITPGENILSATYAKQQMEANYIVYFGKYEYPIDESLTENAYANSKWTDYLGTAFFTASDDTSNPKVGANSFKLSATTTGSFIGMWYATLPSLDTNKFGTRRTNPTLGFYFKRTSAVNLLKIYLGTGTPSGAPNPSNSFVKTLTSQLPPVNEWGWVTTDIGTDWRSNDWTVAYGTPDWSDLDYLLVHFEGGGTGTNGINIDGLGLSGIVTRAAYQNGASRYKIKLITDSLARTANLSASDDSGTVAQLCKAEYLRAKTTPTLSSIVLKGVYPTILPGQIIQSLSYRITEVHFHLDGKNAYTELSTTDDLTNSYPAENLSFGPTAQYNALMRAVNPDFQDRDRGTLKAREIDIDQAILAKSYA